MSKYTLEDISKAMRHIDICMLTTKYEGGLEARPMSNNKQVDYDGNSYFFTMGNNNVCREIRADQNVGLSYIHQPALAKNLYISISGNAELITSRTEMEKHWTKDLDLWFKQGLDTPELTMIHVKARQIKYWHGFEEGEIIL